jgi:predicted nucleotidyltransferase
MTRDDILNFLRLHKQEIESTYGVTRIGLFGSYARQTAREDSDIDLVVEIDKSRKTFRNFFNLKRYLEEGLGKPIDLGMESALKPVVKQAIKNDIFYA